MPEHSIDVVVDANRPPWKVRELGDGQAVRIDDDRGRQKGYYLNHRNLAVQLAHGIYHVEQLLEEIQAATAATETTEDQAAP